MSPHQVLWDGHIFNSALIWPNLSDLLIYYHRGTAGRSYPVNLSFSTRYSTQREGRGHRINVCVCDLLPVAFQLTPKREIRPSLPFSVVIILLLLFTTIKKMSALEINRELLSVLIISTNKKKTLKVMQYIRIKVIKSWYLGFHTGGWWLYDCWLMHLFRSTLIYDSSPMHAISLEVNRTLIPRSLTFFVHDWMCF